jgi:hypothetical protein
VCAGSCSLVVLVSFSDEKTKSSQASHIVGEHNLRMGDGRGERWVWSRHPDSI